MIETAGELAMLLAVWLFHHLLYGAVCLHDRLQHIVVLHVSIIVVTHYTHRPLLLTRVVHRRTVVLW